MIHLALVLVERVRCSDSESATNGDGWTAGEETGVCYGSYKQTW